MLVEGAVMAAASSGRHRQEAMAARADDLDAEARQLAQKAAALRGAADSVRKGNEGELLLVGERELAGRPPGRRTPSCEAIHAAAERAACRQQRDLRDGCRRFITARIGKYRLRKFIH